METVEMTSSFGKEEIVAGNSNSLGDALNTVTLNIPSHAVGTVIGTGGAHIMMLRQMPNIHRVNITDKAANIKIITISGSVDAVRRVVDKVQLALRKADKHLSDNSRQVHSWEPTRTGRILASREVHKTGELKPQKGSKKYDKEQARIKQVSQRLERDSIFA